MKRYLTLALAVSCVAAAEAEETQTTVNAYTAGSKQILPAVRPLMGTSPVRKLPRTS